MIYLFHGSDVEKVRSKAFQWVAAARAKEPNLAYVRLAREELSDSVLEDAALSGGLFVKRLLVLIDDPFPGGRAADTEESAADTASSVVEAHIDSLAASDNAIIILAPKLAAAKAKKIAAKAEKTYTFDRPAAREDARGFNSALVNALAARSREKLWLEINRALYAGDAPEMLHGLLHWKARDLMAKGSRTWSAQESRQLSLSLIELLQSSRRGGQDLSLSLERFALSL
jgi:DNA polymerase III delta subunit